MAEIQKFCSTVWGMLIGNKVKVTDEEHTSTGILTGVHLDQNPSPPYPEFCLWVDGEFELSPEQCTPILTRTKDMSYKDKIYLGKRYDIEPVQDTDRFIDDLKDYAGGYTPVELIRLGYDYFNWIDEGRAVERDDEKTPYN